MGYIISIRMRMIAGMILKETKIKKMIKMNIYLMKLIKFISKSRQYIYAFPELSPFVGIESSQLLALDDR